MGDARSADPAVAPRATWVVGGHGLLGGAVTARLRSLGRPARRLSVPWGGPEASEALHAFARELPPEGVEVYWCAGAGVIGSARSALDLELASFQSLLDGWSPAGEGNALFVASTAGGLYGGSMGPPYTERTEPVPVTDYGRARLAAEAATVEFAERSGVGVLVGRISNLYGPGQNLAKAQGLVAHLCKAHVTRKPMSVYVSADTIRDYLYVEDAAQMVVEGLDAVRQRGGRHVKILASEQPASIAAVIGALHRVTRRRPPVIFGTSPSAGLQVRDLRFRSTAWPSTRHLVRTPLPVGISATLHSVARQLCAAADSH